MLPKQLAELTGIDAGAISRYISGERKPNAESIVKICDGLNVPYEFALLAAAGRKPKISAKTQLIKEADILMDQLEENDVRDLIDLGRGKLRRNDKAERDKRDT